MCIGLFDPPGISQLYLIFLHTVQSSLKLQFLSTLAPLQNTLTSFFRTLLQMSLLSDQWYSTISIHGHLELHYFIKIVYNMPAGVMAFHAHLLSLIMKPLMQWSLSGYASRPFSVISSSWIRMESIWSLLSRFRCRSKVLYSLNWSLKSKVITFLLFKP